MLGGTGILVPAVRAVRVGVGIRMARGRGEVDAPSASARRGIVARLVERTAPDVAPTRAAQAGGVRRRASRRGRVAAVGLVTAARENAASCQDRVTPRAGTATATLPAIRGRRGTLTATDRRHVSGAESRRYRDRGSQAFTPGAENIEEGTADARAAPAGVSQVGRYTAPTAAPDRWWFPVPLTGQSATKATTPTSPTPFCPKCPRFQRFKSFGPAEVPAVALPLGTFPDPSALNHAVHAGTARDIPIPHPMNPIPLRLAVHEGTFLDFPIRQPNNPIPFRLAVHEGTFRDSPIRQPNNPIPQGNRI